MLRKQNKIFQVVHVFILFFLVKICSMSKVIPFVPVKIDENSIQSGAKEVLRVVRPQWTKYGDSSIKSKVNKTIQTNLSLTKR